MLWCALGRVSVSICVARVQGVPLGLRLFIWIICFNQDPEVILSDIAYSCSRPWQDSQGRGERSRHTPYPGGLRAVLFRGPHRLQGPRWLHGHRALRPRCQHEPASWWVDTNANGLIYRSMFNFLIVLQCCKVKVWGLWHLRYRIEENLNSLMARHVIYRYSVQRIGSVDAGSDATLSTNCLP